MVGAETPRWWRSVQAGLGALCLLTSFLGGSEAWAHPFQDGLAGHRLRLTVMADRVEADLMVEEPVVWVLRDLRAFLADVEDPGPEDQERYNARRLDEFEDGLQLYVDGERVRWERLEWDGDNGVGTEQFIVYGLRLQAPLDPHQPDVSVHVLDVVHPDARVARMTEVWGSWDTDLRGCSLWADGETDRTGQWTLGDGTAELRLTRRRTSLVAGAWARAGLRLREGSDGPVRVGPAGVAGPVDARLALSGLAGLALVGCAGALVQWRRKHL